MAEGKEEQVPSYMDGSRQRENEEDAKVETPDKTIRSCDIYSLPREQYRGNLQSWRKVKGKQAPSSYGRAGEKE